MLGPSGNCFLTHSVHTRAALNHTSYGEAGRCTPACVALGVHLDDKGQRQLGPKSIRKLVLQFPHYEVLVEGLQKTLGHVSAFRSQTH